MGREHRVRPSHTPLVPFVGCAAVLLLCSTGCGRQVENVVRHAISLRKTLTTLTSDGIDGRYREFRPSTQGLNSPPRHVKKLVFC
jgi:hypothetical protein